jgi:RND family efflux transporter MFP subunit
MVIVILVIAGISLVKLRKSQLENIRIEDRHAISVEAATVKSGTFKKWNLYLGTLKSDQQTRLKSRIQGQVTHVYKREGEEVVKGEVILELDGIEGSATATRRALELSIKNQKKAISEMNMTLNNLREMYKRDTNLYENHAISMQALEESENRMKAGEIQLANQTRELVNMQTTYSFYKVSAPFSGVVSEIICNEGDVIMPGGSLLKMENTGRCKLVVTVGSNDIPKIRQDSEARILFDTRRQVATVNRIHPSTTQAGTGLVEISLDRHPFNLPLGAMLSVEIPTQIIDKAIILPNDGVLTAQKSIVYKIVNRKIEPVSVELLGNSSDSCAVRGDLKEGDQVVRGSDSLFLRLFEGMPVIVHKGA